MISRQTHAYYVRQEGLAADIRVESERKIKSLEVDLVAAERANKERTLATRYHKVKFFGALSFPLSRESGAFKMVVLDRQKLLRKIKQTKRRLEEDGVSSKGRKALEKELFELRVDLNYVLVRLKSFTVTCRGPHRCSSELPETGKVYLAFPSRRAAERRCRCSPSFSGQLERYG